MGLKAASVRSARPAIILAALFFVTLLSAQAPPAKTPHANSFDDQAASQLLLKLSEALQGHSEKQFLALFDLNHMKDGVLFKQQISSFYSQTESIRIHINLAEMNADEKPLTFSVDAEMEVEPSNGGPVAHQNERVTFTVVNSGGWKFIDVQPRGFFSLP
jgi:hypothetical protein